MNEESRVESLAEMMRACGDGTRLRILNLLCTSSELCVYDLVGVTGASQPKVSRHLALLRRAGLVKYRKDGLWVYYRIVRDPDAATALLLDALEGCFRLLPDLERDIVELERTISVGAVARWHQRLPETEPTPSTATIPLPSAVFPRDEAELEVELL